MTTVALAIALVVISTTLVHAGLSSPPASHIEAMDDGEHVLVFLSPVPAAEDDGRHAIWPDGPDGRTIDLRETFAASGCYEIASKAPMWTAPWDGRDRWVVDADGRHMVRWNPFGDGQYMRGGDLSWALKFYDSGHEIKRYDVADLLDFPSLMQYTTWDWHFQWYDDDRRANFENYYQDGFYVFTSTHEFYRFDIMTGAILKQHHLWRPLSWTALSVATAVAAAALWRRHRARFAASLKHPISVSVCESRCVALPIVAFSIRQLLGFMTITAISLWMVLKCPHVFVFLASGIVAIALTLRLLRLRTTIRQQVGRPYRHFAFVSLLIIVSIAWLGFYILSQAPIWGLLLWLEVPNDVRMAIALTVYRPLVCLQNSHPLMYQGIVRWYCDAWK